MNEFLNNLFEIKPKPMIVVSQERRQVSLLSLGVLSILLFSLVAQIVAVIAIPDAWLKHPVVNLALGSACMYLVAQPLSLLFFGRCSSSAPQEKRLSAMELLSLISVGFSLMAVGSYAGTMINNLISLLLRKTPSNPVEQMIRDVPLWAILVFTVIAAPILEEWIFRRVLIRRLLRYGELPAVLVSGVAFGLIHGNVSQFCYATLLGIFFGAVYVKTGRLRYTIFLHLLLNFHGSFYTTVMLRVEEHWSLLMTGGYYLFYLICFVGLIPSLTLLSRHLPMREGEVTLTGETARRILWSNPVFWGVTATLLLNLIANTVLL